MPNSARNKGAGKLSPKNKLIQALFPPNMQYPPVWLERENLSIDGSYLEGQVRKMISYSKKNSTGI